MVPALLTRISICGMSDFGLLDERVDGLAIGEVALISLERSTQRRDFLLDFTAAGFQRSRDTDDVRTGFGQADRHRFADAAFAAGDEGCLSGKIKLIEELFMLDCGFTDVVCNWSSCTGSDT